MEFFVAGLFPSTQDASVPSVSASENKTSPLYATTRCPTVHTHHISSAHPSTEGHVGCYQFGTLMYIHASHTRMLKHPCGHVFSFLLGMLL